MKVGVPWNPRTGSGPLPGRFSDMPLPQVGPSMTRRVISGGPCHNRVKNIMQRLRTRKRSAPLLRAIDGYQGHFLVKCALRLAPLLFVRPGELRRAEWAEIDLDEAVWNIPASKMKMKEPHLVPLSVQAVEILRELQPLTGSGHYVFPSVRSVTKPMSENTVNAAIRCMGYAKETMTGHGFRAMARTILDEVLQVQARFHRASACPRRPRSEWTGLQPDGAP